MFSSILGYQCSHSSSASVRLLNVFRYQFLISFVRNPDYGKYSSRLGSKSFVLSVAHLFEVLLVSYCFTCEYLYLSKIHHFHIPWGQMECCNCYHSSQCLDFFVFLCLLRSRWLHIVVDFSNWTGKYRLSMTRKRNIWPSSQAKRWGWSEPPIHMCIRLLSTWLKLSSLHHLSGWYRSHVSNFEYWTCEALDSSL